MFIEWLIRGIARLVPKGIVGLVAATTVATSGVVGYTFLEQSSPSSWRQAFAEEQGAAPAPSGAPEVLGIFVAASAEADGDALLPEDESGDGGARGLTLATAAEAVNTLLSAQTSTIALAFASSTPAGATSTPIVIALAQTAGLPTFTPAALALHNRAGDCYVAYGGTVYDVSAHPSWAGCAHHGMHGGIDITPFFPHPTSYLNTLPLRGALVTATVVAVSATTTATSSASGTAATAPSVSSASRRYGDDDEDDGAAWRSNGSFIGRDYDDGEESDD